ADQYVTYLKQRFWVENVDEKLERKAFLLVSDPPAMKRLIVEHLHSMWQKYLSSEWERVHPMLLESVHAFRRLDLHGKTLFEAASMVAGRDLPSEKWEETFVAAQRVLFVPNAHIGPYLFRVCVNKEEPVILFGARLPSDSTIDVPDLNRTEAVMRLSALADDTRLRILRYVAESGELRSQEIMEALDLSQPATSRHLTQLAATGYLKERRCDGAKCYALNPERISATFQALSNYLLIGERSRK
ncbi:ArsR family transcriptional regulator, partial [bacterium]